MFKLFSRHYSKVHTNDLLTSKLYSEANFYNAFLKDLKKARVEVIIESPFLACKRTQSLLPAFYKLNRRGIKVRINTRNPRHHEYELQIQAWKSIKLLRSAGVKVKFYDDMRHRKIAIIDRDVLWEGSLNILSQNYSKEVMRRTQSQALAKQMLNFTGASNWF